MSEIPINCIFCIKYGKTPDTGGHLYVNKEKKVFHCKRCGHSGGLKKGESPWDLFSLDTALPRYRPPKTNFDKIELFSFELGGANKDRAKVAFYAIKRLGTKIPLEKCMWSPDMPGRLFFPVFEGDKLVSWQARSIDDSKPKYLSWGKVSEYVYNASDEYAGHKWNYAVVNEGPVNALSCPHGVALFGKSLSHTQFLILTHMYDTIYIALDYGAEEKMEEIAERFSKFVEVKIITFEDERDANDLGWDVMKQKIKNARPYAQYLLEQIEAEEQDEG